MERLRLSNVINDDYSSLIFDRLPKHSVRVAHEWIEMGEG